MRKPRAKKEPAAETPTAESAYQLVAVKPSDESVYQQLTAVEHVLLRPGMYIGTTAAQTEPAWVLEGGAMAVLHCCAMTGATPRYGGLRRRALAEPPAADAAPVVPHP